MIKNNIQILNTFSEIQDNVDSLEEWLQEMENTLKQPLPLNSRWSKRAINEKMKELKVSLSLQRLFILSMTSDLEREYTLLMKKIIVNVM